MDATTTNISSPSSPPPPSPSPPPPPPNNSTPQAEMLLNPPSIASAAASRRVPPPCWSSDETIALIDAYREKWYSLRRGNLRSHHWQEVADQVAAQFPASPKTCVQCRHKMEKLRKRYRNEKQRAAAFSGGRNSRFKSSWAHFKRMDDMERGTHGSAAQEEEEEEEEEEEHRDYTPPNFLKPVAEIYRNNVSSGNRFGVNENRNVFQTPPMINGANGYRIRLNERSAPVAAPVAKFYANYDEFGVPKANVRSSFGGSSQVLRNEYGVRAEIGRKVGVDERKKGSPTGEMVEAIRVLGDRFVRAEKMKMDMAREVEEMRMEMEMKRTAMILDSQQQIVQAIANVVFESVSKKKKMQSSEFLGKFWQVLGHLGCSGEVEEGWGRRCRPRGGEGREGVGLE